MTPRYSAADVARRRRLLRRGGPAMAAVALTALAIGAVVGSGPGRAERQTVSGFAAHWAAGEYAAMYALLDDDVRSTVTLEQFTAAYRAAGATATARALSVGRPGKRRGDAIPVPVTVRTRVFGTVRGVVDVPLSRGGDGVRIAWRPTLVFPGLRGHEQLTRQTQLPERATLLARDGTVLARGSQRTSDAPDVAGHVVGGLETIPADQLDAMRALGYPDDAQVGASGLERVFEQQLAGRPGGTLSAGGRVLAHTQPRAGAAVTTTISPSIERTAIAQMGGRYGGIVALDPATGEILALAGVAYSGLQPPGSTFKIVTLTGALEARIATPASTYPVVSEALLSGVPIQNANGEYCGGTLVSAFAQSCNSVFAPLGARLGAQRLVDVAERFGFNRPLPIPGAAESTIPTAAEIGDDLAIGSSAIGQGDLQATALQMTLVAATIAERGRQPVPTLQLHARPRFVTVTMPGVARQVARMMHAVVAEGTGTAAQIDGVEVAGKTGTAELRSTVPSDDQKDDPHLHDDIPDTDAWFVAFAPERTPRIAVGVLFSEAGAGGDVAAPAAREVLVASLQQRSATTG
jgi:cell division protein FtsI/penicillin-binding protein 2